MRLRNSKRALASASTSTTINPESELEVEVTGESEAPTPTPTPLEKPNETLTQPTVKSNPTSGSEAVNHVQKNEKPPAIYGLTSNPLVKASKSERIAGIAKSI
ncbi:hypothetical protein PCANC_22622 [Puccinia coronata f. sp. avenae]|uniref:Uncharacterized protein n=1 Tax=Puccinia coronata f. sp. avenae TaxID=200324 RepID=A0A2N5S4H1_9BASI|nr:hypothetical protein PCANC_22622 [Puccinia coronata f. sp. avenae]